MSIRLPGRIERCFPSSRLHQHCCLSVCGDGGGSVGCGEARNLPVSLRSHFSPGHFVQLSYVGSSSSTQGGGTCESFVPWWILAWASFSSLTLAALHTPCQVSASEAITGSPKYLLRCLAATLAIMQRMPCRAISIPPSNQTDHYLH